jgi:hypothetical protein
MDQSAGQVPCAPDIKISQEHGAPDLQTGAGENALAVHRLQRRCSNGASTARRRLDLDAAQRAASPALQESLSNLGQSPGTGDRISEGAWAESQFGVEASTPDGPSGKKKTSSTGSLQRVDRVARQLSRIPPSILFHPEALSAHSTQFKPFSSSSSYSLHSPRA